MRRIHEIIALAALLGIVGLAPAMADEPDAAAAAAQQPKRTPQWLGVMCYPVRGALRSQLGLPQGKGLVVMDVVADGPGAKAGIQQHDILLSAAGKPLGNLRVLSRLVDEHGGKVLTIELLRGGEKQTVEVSPAPRPEDQAAAAIDPADPAGDRRAIREWVERLAPEADLGVGPNRRLRLRFFHPGEIFGGELGGENWPDDLSISITREGKGPAKITVRSGEEKWEISRDEIGKLPEKLRPFVEELLGTTGGPAGQQDIEVDLPEVQLPELGDPADQPDPQLEKPADGHSDKTRDARRRLEEIRRQLDQLQKELGDEK